MNQRPAINMAAFAKECGISQSLLHLIIQNKRTLTHARAKEVKPVAVKYGYSEWDILAHFQAWRGSSWELNARFLNPPRATAHTCDHDRTRSKTTFRWLFANEQANPNPIRDGRPVRDVPTLPDRAEPLFIRSGCGGWITARPATCRIAEIRRYWVTLTTNKRR